jgi:hypothetical protein
MIFGRESSPKALRHGGGGCRASRAAARKVGSSVCILWHTLRKEHAKRQSSVVDDLGASVVSWDQQRALFHSILLAIG